MRHTFDQSGYRWAFTLIELLVVIAIVALLMAVLLPALGHVRHAAQSVQCLSHQRQLGTATQMYQDDFAEYFPQPLQSRNLRDDRGAAASGEALWYNALDAYLGLPRLAYAHGDEAQRHHVAIKHDPVWTRFDPEQQSANRTIKMSAYLSLNHAGQWAFYRRQDVAEPSRTVMFVDGRSSDVHPAGTNHDLFHATPGTVGLRHNDGANVVFVDGHGRHVVQAVNPSLAAPGWHTEGSGEQELVWQIVP